MMHQDLIVRQLGKKPYQAIWDAMRQFTDRRDEETADELWLLQHLPVFTQGLAGSAEHVLDAKEIPVVQSDRGGQVTYHGPGQLMAYTLFDLNRLKLGTRDFVIKLEKTVIDLLSAYQIKASGRRDAPGIYVDNAKICSIGLRVRKGYSYHGIALNVDMDLTPFSYINPCGVQGLHMTQLADQIQQPPTDLFDQVKYQIISYFMRHFGYTRHILYQELPMELTV